MISYIGKKALGGSVMRAEIRACIFCLVSLALSGCASMSADECRTADWQTIGYEDGLKGHTGERIARHRKACAKAEITPDLDGYEAGRERGLRVFCKPANAFNLGSDGYNYQGICPADLEADFLVAYEDGRGLYELKEDVRRTQKDINELNSDLDSAEEDLEEAEKLLVSDDTSSDERRDLLQEVKDLTRDIQYMHDELVHKRAELYKRERRAKEYRDDVTSYSGSY